MTYKILFVCLGNICRSSAAEEIMRQQLVAAGLDTMVTVDSAGLINYHEGELTDPRMRDHAFRRGYKITHRSRPIQTADFQYFDLIIGMDHSNIQSLRRLAQTPQQKAKIHLITEFTLNTIADIVPDPYYGGPSGFEHVLDLLEDCTSGLVSYLQTSLPQ